MMYTGWKSENKREEKELNTWATLYMECVDDNESHMIQCADNNGLSSANADTIHTEILNLIESVGIDVIKTYSKCDLDAYLAEIA